MKQSQEDELQDYLRDAKGIAWDTCHKVYILMDDKQMELMRTYEYDPLISSDQMSASEMFDTVVRWYEDSCGLRFIQAVTTIGSNGEEDFHEIIGQFNDLEEEEDND
jgi:hypothetical protein